MIDRTLGSSLGSPWGIIGHQRAVALLQRAIDAERIAHAYLICGPRQVGKTTLALTFARALNCTQSPPPCDRHRGECRSCLRITKGVHPDVRLLKLGGDGSTTEADRVRRRSDRRRIRQKTISIEEVRDMIHEVALAPYESRQKCFIIRYAEDLSGDAIQTLLKTLEEPPPHVTLTLTTADAKILPPTIVSRCQVVQLAPVPTGEIELALASRFHADPEQAKLLAHLSAGRVGWAIDALAGPDAIADRVERVGTLLRALVPSRVERLDVAERLAAQFGREPEGVVDLLELWLEWWRDVLMTKNRLQDQVVNVDRRQELEQHASYFQEGQVLAAMQAIRRTLRQLQQNANPRLALEVLVLSLPVATR